MNGAASGSQTITSPLRVKHYSYSLSKFLGNGNFSKVYGGLNELNSTHRSIQINLSLLRSRISPS
jgi:hypothetical protein